MPHTLLQIVDSNLCFVEESNNNILKIHKPFFQKFMDFKLVANRVIIQEETNDQYKSNIYCLDTDFNLIWFSELPFESDKYPNAILWDSELNTASDDWDNAYLPNSDFFTTSSSEGVTVSINYITGKIEKSILTK